METAEIVEPTKNLTLYDREEHLQALYNTLDVVEPGMEDELKAEIQKALTSAVEKRERIIHMIQDEEDRIETAKARIKGFQQFVKTREAHLEKFQAYVASVIKAMGTDGKGKYPTLKGITGQLSIRKCPDSVTLLDEDAIPPRFKTLTIEVGLEDWQEHLAWCLERKRMENLQNVGTFGYDVEDESIETLGPIRVKDASIDKAAIKKAIESGHDVPGADISYGQQVLSVK